jgi:hypothetical protein
LIEVKRNICPQTDHDVARALQAVRYKHKLSQKINLRIDHLAKRHEKAAPPLDAMGRVVLFWPPRTA